MLQVSLFVPSNADALEHALEGLVALDAFIIRDKQLPPLMQTGARYRPEKGELWRNCLQVIKDGWGDCEDLSAYRAAELRVYNSEPARLILIKTGPRLLHAVVQRANGEIEDPSKLLGMKGRG